MSECKLAMVRTPLRISLVGGGSDLPGGEGQTLSSSINKHVYCIAKRRLDRKLYLTWRRKEEVDHAMQLKHELVREALLKLGVKTGLEVITFADVPGTGSGLGSSAATTVAVLHAVLLLLGWDDKEIERRWLAEMAADVEINRVGRSCGRQDQYACSLGGFLHLKFDDGAVKNAVRLHLSKNMRARLNNSFLLFSPPQSAGRSSEEILKEFTNDDEFRKECVRLVSSSVERLLNPPDDDGSSSTCTEWWLGGYVADHHRLKTGGFPGYLPEGLNELPKNLQYKLCGAGGTGHLLVSAMPEDATEVINRVCEHWGPPLPFEFEEEGSTMVYRE